MPSILVDTSFLVAVYNQDDPLHKRAVAGVDADASLLVPQVVLVETLYLLKKRAGVSAAVQVLTQLFEGHTPLIPLEDADVVRARDIMAMYADARFDFVDCCVMALAERLNITRVYTFDRRDFQIFRPRHCDYLELLP